MTRYLMIFLPAVFVMLIPGSYAQTEHELEDSAKNYDNLDMQQLIQSMSDTELDYMADYLSRLEPAAHKLSLRHLSKLKALIM